MNPREKIRFLGVIVIITGIAFILLAVCTSLDKNMLLLVTDFSATGGIGGFLCLLGTILAVISVIIPEYWIK